MLQTLNKEQFQVELKERFDRYSDTLPTHLIPGLWAYVSQGVMPGNFLTAVIRNDLYSAVLYADRTSLEYLGVIVDFVTQLPLGACGSEKMMDEWILKVREINKEQH